uniref:Uncharacterized protein n=1 Tax=Clastoptera arizonana TaxID=38151 RepID=A0A1B6CYP4_9HEMI
MSSHKFIQGKELLSRMNFLYQAANLTLTNPCEKRVNLAAYYGTLLKNVGKKGIQRLDPEIKRTICKGCNLIMIPGNTVNIRLKKKPNSCITWTCLKCYTVKRFMTKKDHKIWVERNEAVVEIIQIGQGRIDNGYDYSIEAKDKKNVNTDLNQTQ